MAAAREAPPCTICGLSINQALGLDRIDKQRPTRWFPDIWLECGILLSGPHYPYYEKGPQSLKIPSTFIIRHYARLINPEPRVQIVPNGPSLLTQHEEDLEESDRYHPDASQRWYLGVHAACEEIALLAIQTQKYHLRSVGDLWMALDRRCTKTTFDTSLWLSFLPKIPEIGSGEDIRLGFGRYFIPQEILLRNGDDWYGEEEWWEADPILIPDLTVGLMSNLRPAPQTTTFLPQFDELFATLPKEVNDQVVSLVIGESVALECNYLLSQSFWKQLFLQIPFLWDLDLKTINQKTKAGEEKWDWEKLTRQLLSPVTIPVVEGDNFWDTPWDYSQVGLILPGGLTNRRRIWQIVTEMYPNDVGMHHCMDDEPEK